MSASMSDDPLGDDVLFDIERPPPVALADKFGVPPLSVLDRRAGLWQGRKRRWGSMKMQSELGRTAAAMSAAAAHRTDWFAKYLRGEVADNRSTTGNATVGKELMIAGGVSIFDPVLCELIYRWYSPIGGTVLDPFAGGSVRGVVASTLHRRYTGIDLRPEQVGANIAQMHLCTDFHPTWVYGDSRRMTEALEHFDQAPFDLVFSCPPYGNLEEYSDNPADLSTMEYEQFTEAHADIISQATSRLKDDRFACWVVSDIRDGDGFYRGLAIDTVLAFRKAGLRFLNDIVVMEPVGTAALRAEKPFVTTRKATRVHQNLLVFVKGDVRKAVAACTPANEVELAVTEDVEGVDDNSSAG